MKYAKLVIRNILRNRRRTVLTILSLAGSLFLIVTLATVLTEFTRGSDEANPLRLIARHGVSLAFQLPIAYRERIASVPGVQHVLPFHWFGGIYKEPKNFFANFTVDARLLRAHSPEMKMSDPQWQAFIDDRQGAIVGGKLVERFGFQIGQRITLKSPIYRISPEVIIRGIYTGGDEKTLFFHHEYFNEMTPAWSKDKVSTFGIMAKKAEDVPRIAREVDAMFLNSDAPSKTENEREFAMSFEAMMGSVKTFLYGIITAIVFSILLVTANTMAMNVRERTNEVGTLKALGFQRGAIAGMFLGESLVLAVVGALMGIGGAALLYRSIDLSLYIPNFNSFTPQNWTLLGAFLLALIVGLVSVSFSALRVTRLTTAEALRRVE
ncbi:MAG TPA: FtsX-like permease family protein [Acidobacteriota bacterium]|jgi:putative ABC transport system permease protein